MKQLYSYEFDKFNIDFEFETKENVMVNATQMAKVFDRKVEPFTRNEDTKNFISECLKSENSSFLGVQNIEDLVTSKQKSGTWMHRILALKFAAWLNPAFELWVYSTIDELLFGHYRELENSLKNSATNRTKKEEIHTRLLLENTDYKELVDIDDKEKKAIAFRRKFNSEQLDLFSQTPN